MKLPNNKELEDMLNKLQKQTADNEADDMYNKMGMLYTFVKKYVEETIYSIKQYENDNQPF